MANGFDYKSPIDTLLSVTLPRFLENELTRQERSRQFDQRLAFNEQQALTNQQQAQENFQLRREQFNFQKGLQQTKEDEEFDQGLVATLDSIRNYPDYVKQVEILKDRLKTDKYKNILNTSLITAESNNKFINREIESLSNLLGEPFRDYAEGRLSSRVNVSDADFSRVAQNYISSKASLRAEDSVAFDRTYKSVNQASEVLKGIIDFRDAKTISDRIGADVITSRFPILTDLTEDELNKRQEEAQRIVNEGRQQLFNFLESKNLPTNSSFNPNLTSETDRVGENALGIKSYQNILGSTPKYQIPSYDSLDISKVDENTMVRIGDNTSGFVGVIGDDGNITLTVDNADAEIIQKALENNGEDIYVDGNQATDVRKLSTTTTDSVEVKGDDDDAQSRLANKDATTEESVGNTLLGFLTGGRVTQSSDIPTIQEGVDAAGNAITSNAQSAVSGSTREQVKAVRNAGYGINESINTLISGKRKGLSPEEINQANEELKNLIVEATKAAENSNNLAVKNNLNKLINNTHAKINRAIKNMQKTDDDIKYFYDDTVAIINAMKEKISAN
jgi:hypothetical protein